MTMRTKEEYKQLMEKVNDYWIGENPDTGDCSWERSAYFLGNMAAYDVLGKQEYLDYALRWANSNNWSFYIDTNENNPYRDNMTCADYQICGQTYLKLLSMNPEWGTDEHMIEVMERALADEKNDYWWWVDTVYMALPYYSMMGVTYNDDRYFDKVHRLFTNAKTERNCYDTEEHLWFRDERFLPDKARTMNGKKVFWSRGNGWVFAGLARTLDVLPEDNKYYAEYCQIFKEMAAKLRTLICEDGFWRVSLIEPDEYPMPETSGTAFFVLGMLMGVRMGILDKSYLECAMKGFEGLTTEALEESGRIGWVQVVADQPGPVRKESTNDYSVGAYLLILKELIEAEE